MKYGVENEKLLEIEFIDGKKVKLTKEHPLLAVVNGKKLLSLLWMKAEKLKEGDSILSVGKSLNDLIPLKIKTIKEQGNLRSKITKNLHKG